jgi:hypothetical protein
MSDNPRPTSKSFPMKIWEGVVPSGLIPVPPAPQRIVPPAPVPPSSPAKK